MTINPGADKGSLSEPPEVEVELVREDSVTPPELAAPPRKPSNNFLKLAAGSAFVLAIAGAGYWGVRGSLKSRADAAGRESAALASSDSPVEAVVVEPATAPPAASLPADEGDALAPVLAPTHSATADPAAATTSPVAQTASAMPQPQPGVAQSPAAVIAAPGDALAALEAAAEKSAANESNGLVSAPAPAASNVAEPVVTAPEPSPELAGELQALRVRFESETNRLAGELSAERARADMQAGEIAALRADLAGLAAPTPAAVPAPAQAAPIVGLGEPADTMITRGLAAPEIATPSAPRESGERATLVLMALSRAIERGQPFKEELARAEALAPRAPAIEELRLAASEGAPTLATLKSRFPAEARAALAAEAGKGGGLFGRFSAGAAELVSVRPSGPVKGARPAAVLSRIEARLTADDIDGALEEFKTLQGPARDTLAPFIADAGRLAGARASLDRLNLHLIEAAAR